MANASTYELTEADTKLPASLGALGPKLLIAGVAMVLVALAWDYFGMAEPEGHHNSAVTHWQFSYLTGFFYWLTIVLGGMIFLLIQHVFRSGWSVVVRRPAEAVVSCIPVMALLVLPIVIPIAMQNDTLYKWVDPQTRIDDMTALPSKVVVYDNFLNVKFFLVRVAIYFGMWVLMSRLLVKSSAAQDSDGDIKHTRKMEMRAAPGILAFALTLTFAGFDMLMSLDPHWFSTIWGVYLFAGSMTSFMSLLALLSMCTQSKGGLKFVNQEHHHDIGKLMFGFVVFFGYIGFSQFLL
ncbi:MAG: quinol:cytochrome C oxidoreductase, partial [Planctomycetota bacterium]